MFGDFVENADTTPMPAVEIEAQQYLLLEELPTFLGFEEIIKQEQQKILSPEPSQGR